MKVYLTDSLDGRLSLLPMPAAVTMRQVSLEQVRKTIDQGATGLFGNDDMAATVMGILNRRIAQARHQVHIEHGDQLLLAQLAEVAVGGPRGVRLTFYEVRIAR